MYIHRKFNSYNTDFKMILSQVSTAFVIFSDKQQKKTQSIKENQHVHLRHHKRNAEGLPKCYEIGMRINVDEKREVMGWGKGEGCKRTRTDRSGISKK